MAQSTYATNVAATQPLHVALILDGNGRWAERRGLPRVAGHRAGAEAVRRVIASAPGLGVGTLTLFAFSSDNWRRPPDEVRALFGLLVRYLAREARECARSGVRLSFPRGVATGCPGGIAEALAAAERVTAAGRRLRLRIAIDYSARDTIMAAATMTRDCHDRPAFLAALGQAANESEAAPEVDLLIRTGGERRLSDFLLYECAYAELEFLDCAWPDFRPADLAACLERFARRDRRFGGLSRREAG